MSIEKCLVDEGYKDTVTYQFCRESDFKNVLLPSKGVGARLGRSSMRQWKKRPGESVAPFTVPAWVVGNVSTQKGRHVMFDADEWKTFVSERLVTPPGGNGCLRLFGVSREDAALHELFVRHCTCEMAAQVTADGRTFDKWNKRPGRSDNHWWDGVVGAAVAASVAGLEFSATGAVAPKKQKKPRKTWDEMQREQMGARAEQ
jgi:hypothetical protein